MKLREAVGGNAIEKLNNRFKENDDLKIYKQLVEIIDKVLKESSQAVSAFRKAKIYMIRSNDKRQMASFVAAKKTERPPRDTDKETDEHFEKLRKQFAPNVPSRKSSTFVFPRIFTGKFAIVQGGFYGKYKHIVFPRNGSKYFQSKTVDDFTSSDLAYSINQYLRIQTAHPTNVRETEIADLEKQMLDQAKDYFSNANTKIENFKVTGEGGINYEAVVDHKGYYMLGLDAMNGMAEYIGITPFDILDAKFINAYKEHLKKSRKKIKLR